MFGRLTYLALELLWALPVLALQLAVGHPELWRRRRAWLLATLIPTLYLCVADRVALGNGIWQIAPGRSTGVAIWGLPVEEAVFFLVTNLMVVQALILFCSPETLARVRRWWKRGTSFSPFGRRTGGRGAAPQPIPTLANWPAALAGGYRLGMLGAVAGAILSVLVAAALATDSVLEPLAQAVMQWTPVSVANVLLQRLGSAARPLALLGAQALLMVVGGALGAFAAACARRLPRLGAAAATLALVASVVAAFARQAALWPALAYAVGQVVLLGNVLRRAGSAYLPGQPGRRPVASLVLTAEDQAGRTSAQSIAPLAPAAHTRRTALRDSALVLGGAGAVTGVSLADAARRDTLSGAAGTPLFTFTPPEARDPAFAGPDLQPEVTPATRFYVVSKNAQDPVLDARRWRLRVGGRVARPFAVTFDELLRLPRVDQYVTLQCVSNPVGGSLMSNALWSGAPLAALLERAGPLSGGRVVFRAPDGHEESVPLDLALQPQNLVAYAMNGDLLTRLHGHPARMLLPGLYGFKQVKWLTQIELAPESYRGYWEQRGWGDEAVIRTTARIDLARREAGSVRTAGMALTGERSVARVEARLLAGDRAAGSWQPAQLHVPSLSPMTWVQWRTLLPVPAALAGQGELTVEARAVDGTGEPQAAAPSSPFPRGASGYHRLPVK